VRNVSSHNFFVNEIVKKKKGKDKGCLQLCRKKIEQETLRFLSFLFDTSFIFFFFENYVRKLFFGLDLFLCFSAIFVDVLLFF